MTTKVENFERSALVLTAALGLFLGLIVRYWHIFSEPLWLDEAYSAWAADHGLRFLWLVVPRYDTHPPFYYTLLHLWGAVFGDSLAARRMPGLAFGTLTLCVVGLCAGRLAGAAGLGKRDARWMLAAALVLAALHPVLVELTREVRSYALMILVYACGVLWLLGFAQRRRLLRGPALAPLFVAEALLCWLHTLGPLFAASLSLALMILAGPLDRRERRPLLVGHLVVGLAYLPALAIMLDQAPVWIQSTWLRFSWASFDQRLGSIYATPSPLPAIAAAVLLGFGTVLIWRREAKEKLAAALLVLAILPVAAAALVSLAVTPVFLARALSPVVVPAILLMARGVAYADRWRLIGPGLALVLCAGFVREDALSRAQGARQDWYHALRWMEDRYRPGDAIWAYPNEGGLPFDYAARDLGLPLRARGIPGPVPAEIGHYVTGGRGAVSLSGREIARFVAGPEAQTAPTLWLIRLGPNAYDPGDAMKRALAARRAPVSHYQAGALDIVGLRLSGRDGRGAAVAAR